MSVYFRVPRPPGQRRTDLGAINKPLFPPTIVSDFFSFLPCSQKIPGRIAGQVVRIGMVSFIFLLFTERNLRGNPLGTGPAYLEDQPGGALRLPPFENAGAFSVRHWTVGDGLPRQEVLALAQTPDGYLWCGTVDGLVRYDGRRFRTFYANEVPALNGMVIAQLFCDREGRLWISGLKGEVAVLDGGEFRRLGTESGLPEGGVVAAVVSRRGDFWVSSESKWFGRYEGRHFVSQWKEGLRGGKNWWFTAGWAEADHLTWALMDGPLITATDGEKVLNRHLVKVDRNGNYEKIGIVDAGGGPDDLQVFFPLADGTPALVARDGIYAHGKKGWMKERRFDLPMVKTHGAPRSVHHDEKGDFWVGTHYGGLVRCDPDGRTRHFRLPGESRRSDVQALLGDERGNIWVATDGGLYQITRNVVRPLAGSGQALALVEDDTGTIWVARDEAIVALDAEDQIAFSHGLPSDYLLHGVVVDRLGRGRNGQVWVGLSRYRKETQRWEHELWVLSRSDFQFVCPVKARIEALHQSEEGPLLVGTQAGLWRLDDHRALEEFPGTPPDFPVAALGENATGILFAAVTGQGLYRCEDETWRKVEKADGPEAPFIETLSIAPRGGIWAGCGKYGIGLWRDGQWFSFPELEGLPREVTGVIADHHGGLWVTSVTGEGVVRFDGEALWRAAGAQGAPVTGSRLGREDGLPSLVIQENRQPLLRDRLGRILIVSRQGAAAIIPPTEEHTEEDPGEARTHIQTVLVNDQLVRDWIRSDHVDGQEIIEIQPGPRRVEFKYASVHFGSQANTDFRYRLEGYDDKWMPAGGQRSAVYPDLPPGRYRFRVGSRVGQSDWSESPSAVLLDVRPHWWERPLTRALGVLLIGVLLSLFFLIRLRQSKERSRLQASFARALIHSQEEERKRLAGELHDSLGHDLLVLKGSLEREARNSSGTLSRRLLALSGKTAETVEEMRGISHALRPPGLERFGLGPALDALVCDTEEATGIQLNREIGEIGRLPAEIELGLFRIAQEALNNLDKHSDASEGRVSLGGEGETVVLMIEDDGRGFDPEVAFSHSDSLGLTGMDERARLLGGTMQVVSRKTQGTRLTIAIPLSRPQ